MEERLEGLERRLEGLEGLERRLEVLEGDPEVVLEVKDEVILEPEVKLEWEVILVRLRAGRGGGMSGGEWWGEWGEEGG